MAAGNPDVAISGCIPPRNFAAQMGRLLWYREAYGSRVSREGSGWGWRGPVLKLQGGGSARDLSHADRTADARPAAPTSHSDPSRDGSTDTTLRLGATSSYRGVSPTALPHKADFCHPNGPGSRGVSAVTLSSLPIPLDFRAMPTKPPYAYDAHPLLEQVGHLSNAPPRRASFY